ncbi:DUF2079 domain-containing protein [Gloeothece verrucosa]|uniref:Uncharacterized protein n=1 Tax=Gloeothece verrucosa (strain PCC 7822) TaxID=497965 RepID=E0U5M5_GLOV7|nr:DUF2079 domain-containing protein [Gloeothece verrucosa]ADN14738.1 Protein of unknown function DUF2079, membrane [Gloeothece verrucosa PCC 7822]
MGKTWVSRWREDEQLKPVIIAASLFFSLTLFFAVHRYYSFYSNTDHGIFNQVFWNSLHGHFFESTLSSSLSANVIHNGEIPSVSYHRLGQHFTPALLLWLPLYALFPSAATLNVLQVILMTAGGIVLYFLAKHYLPPQIAVMIAWSYYGANAVIGPTLGNFFDLSQLPLFAFGLLLAHAKRCWWLFWVLAALILAIREDAGVILFSLGVYFVFRDKSPQIGLAVCTISLAYMLALTNLIMPLFSDDISKRFMIERFGHFATHEQASTLEIIWSMISNPWRLLVELVSPIGKKLDYLLSQWLPLGLIPAVASAAWLCIAFPLAQLFLQQGDERFAITIRYAVALIPGLFFGAIIWWSGHQDKFKPKIRRFWKICLGLSLLFTFTGNPHRAWFFLMPDSFSPWAYRPLTVQWHHVDQVNTLLAQIPSDASVSASRYLVPQMSARRAVLRFPDVQFRDDQGNVQSVEYIIVDLWQLNPSQSVIKKERREVAYSVEHLDKLINSREYGVMGFKDDALLMKKGVESESQAMMGWLEFRQKIDTLVKGLVEG